MTGLSAAPLKGGRSRRNRKSGGTAMQNPMKSTGGKRRSRRRSRRRKSRKHH